MEQNTINRIFPTVQFYDYTAIRGRDSLENYHLTFSMKEDNLMDVLAEMKRGRNIAVVFPVNEIPSTHLGLPVIDGDETDYRPADPNPCVVGLKVKGLRSEEHTSELQSLMRISYAVFCLKKKKYSSSHPPH